MQIDAILYAELVKVFLQPLSRHLPALIPEMRQEFPVGIEFTGDA